MFLSWVSFRHFPLNYAIEIKHATKQDYTGWNEDDFYLFILLTLLFAPEASFLLILAGGRGSHSARSTLLLLSTVSFQRVFVSALLSLLRCLTGEVFLNMRGRKGVFEAGEEVWPVVIPARFNRASAPSAIFRCSSMSVSTSTLTGITQLQTFTAVTIKIH